MDQSEKINANIPSVEIPSVPIKTYKWEDIRRARKKGGYPWTYLDKKAFDESINPENFKMDGTKKSKTASASPTSDSLEIKEITEDDVKGLEGIDSSYVVIESPILLGRHIDEVSKEQEGIIESADSSDNISQYLDKEERGPEQKLESTETLRVPVPTERDMNREKQNERAKSEEPKKKRRSSIESNYSRVSLSKLGVLKRLKSAKEKLKIPKFSEKSKKKDANEVNKTEIKDQAEGSQKKEFLSSKNLKPVYIHIPLKPPEGETDEFSHLEFEEKKTALPQEVRIEITEEENIECDEENTSNKADPISTDLTLNDTNLDLSVPNDQEDDVSAIIFLEGEEGCENKDEYDIIAVDIDENSQEMKMSQITNTEVKRQFLESIKKVESQPDISKSNESPGVSLSRSSSKASRTSKTSIRKRRAKSVEPEKKRRGSIDSSYSRKSMSKIGLLKKLKSFHIPFMKSQSKKSINENISKTETELPSETSRQESRGKEEKPVYIYIPLKPPEGQTDEFSHLESNDAPPPQLKIENIDSIDDDETDTSPMDTSQASKSPQLIILTPPSDDELLDKAELPDTPSCESGSISQFEDLQQLAKKAVEQIENTLETVVEGADEACSNGNQENMNTMEDAETTENENENKEKLTIDEEDGLKSITQLNDEMKTNLRSNLKSENSPLPKKKVSFKRRKSSQVSKDDGYEEIESPPAGSVQTKAKEVSENEVSVSISETNVTSATHEDDSSREIQQQPTPFEEKGGKWSKISDHEYEPINPPPEEKTEKSPPQSHVSEVLNPSSKQSNEYSDEEALRTGIQHNIEERNTPMRMSPSKWSSRSRSEEKESTRPSKFQAAIKESASKFKTKLQGIKKPAISMPSRPKFQKPNFKKPNINLPKLPDISSTFRRTSKTHGKRENETKASGESSNKSIFDFATYPRIFGKKKQDPDSVSLREGEIRRPEIQDKPMRSSGPPEIIRIPLHSEESIDQDNGIFPQPEEVLEVSQLETNDESSRHRYQEDTEADDEDALQRERQEKHRDAVAASFEVEDSRWDHGYFHRSPKDTEEANEKERSLENDGIPQNYDIECMPSEMITDLDSPDESIFIPAENKKARLQQNDSFETNHSKDVGSSISSLGHRRGVLEEIDSDQFFLREKGISQDNIDMGKYLSTEIREAFRSPANALADIHSYNYEEVRASNQSLPETKRKPVRKPKRRKTPHTSQERIRYEPESENEDYNFMPPIRPKRKSRRKKRSEPDNEKVPLPTIPLYDAEEMENSLQQEQPHHYQNNEMEEIMLPTHYYKHHLQVVELHDAHRRASEPIPAAPPRKHKSLKSLNASEHDSIFEDYGRDEGKNEVTPFEERDVGISSDIEDNRNNVEMQQEVSSPPKPPTRHRSKTRSMSRATSQADRDSILGRMDSIMFDEEFREPVIEEPCIKDLRDSMGYAIVDKNQNKNWEHKFCTVPRSQGSSKPPERPLRNYSTLGPSRPERKASKNMTDEEKENIDLSQYIEIDDERDLQSGEIIQKIQNRPLPAPPRPPRCKSKPLSDITSKSNIDISDSGYLDEKKHQIDETEVSTQTDPLPPDFECEEMIHEDTDIIMTPSALRKKQPQQISNSEKSAQDEPGLHIPLQHEYTEETITHGQLLVEPLNGARILPDSDMSHERTISSNNEEGETSEIPEYFNILQEENLKIGNSSVSKNIGDDKEESNDLQHENSLKIKSSSVDEDKPHKLMHEGVDSEVIKTYSNDIDPQSEDQRYTDEISNQTESQDMSPRDQDNETIKIGNAEPQRPPRTSSQKRESFEILRTQKLQVSDLDVERLTVSELVATKIVVSEIEGENISANEISSKSGKLKLSDLELEPDIVKKLLEQLKEASKEQLSEAAKEDSNASTKDQEVGEKKTSTDFHDLESSLAQNSNMVAPSVEGDEIAPSHPNSEINEELNTENSDDSIISADQNEEPTQQNTEKYNESSEILTSSKENISIFENEDVQNSEEIPEFTPQLENPISISPSTDGNIISTQTKEDEVIDDEIIHAQSILTQVIANIPNSKENQNKEANLCPISNDEENSTEEAPLRPPRKYDNNQLIPTENEEQSNDSQNFCKEDTSEFNDSIRGSSTLTQSLQLQEPEVDEEPPPRPPQPQVPYFPSEPPAEFYNLRIHDYPDNISNDIPLVPRRQRHHRPTTISKSSSSETSNVRISRRRIRSPEPSIPQLTSQLIGACAIVARNKLKRLIDEINTKISSEEDIQANKQNVQVIMVVLLILITILLLMGFGDGRTVHLHHWEYFNPPTNM